MQFIWNRQRNARAARVPPPAPQVEDVQVAHIPEPEPPKVVEPELEPEPEAPKVVEPELVPEPEPPKVVEPEPEPEQDVALPEQEETAPES